MSIRQMRKQFVLNAESLGQADADYIDAVKRNSEDRCRKEEAEYERHRPQRIRDTERDLLRFYRSEMQKPRPNFAPPPQMPSARNIRTEAERLVDERHAQRLQGIRDEADKAVDERVDRILSRRRERFGRDHGERDRER